MYHHVYYLLRTYYEVYLSCGSVLYLCKKCFDTNWKGGLALFNGKTEYLIILIIKLMTLSIYFRRIFIRLAAYISFCTLSYITFTYKEYISCIKRKYVIYNMEN